MCVDAILLIHQILQSSGCKVTGCVSPWFIVGGEHSKVTATNKVLIVHWQQRTGGG